MRDEPTVGNGAQNSGVGIGELSQSYIFEWRKGQWPGPSGRERCSPSLRPSSWWRGTYISPPDAVNREYLKESAHRSACPWKGKASYYTVVVNGEENRDAAWYYPEPKEAAGQIKDHVAFWRGVTVER